MTLVDYIYELLIPYADMPEFTSCVMKALEKLGHITTEKESISGKRCYLVGKDPAKFKACSIECNE
jgi:hypothetical protein